MRRILTVLLVLVLLIGLILPVSAKDMGWFDDSEDGKRYCWVQGLGVEPTYRFPDDPVYKDYHWEKARGSDNKQITQKGTCEYAGRNHRHTDECDEYGCPFGYEHTCSMFCSMAAVQYKWVMVPDEILSVLNRDTLDYAITGGQFKLLMPYIKTNADGSFMLDEEGNLIYGNHVMGIGVVEKTTATAAIRLDREKMDRMLDPNASFYRFILTQNLEGDLYDKYRPVQNRWLVTIVRNNEGKYEVYSINEIPMLNPNSEEAFNELIYGELGEPEFPAQGKYNPNTNTLIVTTEFRLGTIGLDIVVEGYDGFKPKVTITGPDGVSKVYGTDITLTELPMGKYTVTASEPVFVDEYTVVGPQYFVEQPINGRAAEMTEFILNGAHESAKITVKYTYTPPHVHDYSEQVTLPTCTERGYTTYTCKDPACGHTYIDNVVEPGHDYVEVITESTCTTDGYTTFTCKVCGDTYKEDGETAGHGEFRTNVIRPTCTEKGYTTYTCTKCDFSYQDNFVDATGHDFKYTGEVEPTCTEDGHEVYTCAVCMAKDYREGKKATGHDTVAGAEVKATCTADGYIPQICKICEQIVEPEITEKALGHTYTEEVKEPTCLENGHTTYTCSKCGYSYEGDIVAASGHKYVSEVIAPTTQREGYTLHTCTECNDTYTDNNTEKLPEGAEQDKEQNKEQDKEQSKNDKTNSNQNTGSSSASSTLLVKSVDDLGEALEGTEIALYNGNWLVKSWKNTYENFFVLDDLQKYAVEGETVTYKLVQTTAPDGYQLSEDSFRVMISNSNGKTEVQVQYAGASSDKDKGIESNSSGKKIVTFQNKRKATQIELSCRVAVEFGENCWVDEALIAELQEKQYTFTLTWKDADGAEQTESVQLAHGELALLETVLPVETEYVVTVEDPDGVIVMELSESATGTITMEQIKENLTVEAALKYTVQPDEQLALNMVVLDSDSQQSVNGAIFELQDPDGQKIGTFTSGDAGELVITDVFKSSGEYLLTQIYAPEGYGMMRGAAPVIMSYDYVPNTETETPVLMQTISTEIAHQGVKRVSDGSYQVLTGWKNEITEEPEKKGSGIGLILGISGGVVAAGGATTFVLIRRKRKKVQV